MNYLYMQTYILWTEMYIRYTQFIRIHIQSQIKTHLYVFFLVLFC